MNSPDKCNRLGSIVSTFEGGCAAQCTPIPTIAASTKNTTAATTYAHRRSASSMTSEVEAFDISANGASRQKHEDEEGDPENEQDATLRPASASAPRGPLATMRFTSSSPPWTATFSVPVRRGDMLAHVSRRFSFRGHKPEDARTHS